MKRSIPLLALALFTACDWGATTVRPTALILTVNRTSAPPGQPFDFRYEAQGRSLAGLILDYGDGGLDSLGFSGAVTATGTRTHSYSAPGTYIVTGRLEDFLGSTAGAEVQVTVTP